MNVTHGVMIPRMSVPTQRRVRKPHPSEISAEIVKVMETNAVSAMHNPMQLPPLP